MSAARTNPEILDIQEGIKHVAKDTLALPMLSLTKSEIATRVDDFLNDALEEHDASHVYVLLKQMEEAVKAAVKKTQNVAFDSFGKAFMGEPSGECLGHKVNLTWPKEWIYSEAIEELKTRQKAELESAQLNEQAKGIAVQQQKEGQIRVILKAGKEGK